MEIANLAKKELDSIDRLLSTAFPAHPYSNRVEVRIAEGLLFAELGFPPTLYYFAPHLCSPTSAKLALSIVAHLLLVLVLQGGL